MKSNSRRAALLVVAIAPTMSPPSALPREKIHSFYLVPPFMIHDTSSPFHHNIDEMKPMDVPARRGADPQSHWRCGKGKQRGLARKDAVSCHCFGETDY